MIKLNKNIYDSYKNTYIRHCINKIKNNYKPDDTRLFHNAISRDDIFCEEDVISENKIKELLLFDFNNIQSNNNNLVNYFKTCMFISLLKDDTSNITSIIQEYNNPWINAYINKYNNNTITLEQLIKDIQENLKKLNEYKENDKIKKIIDYNYLSKIRDSLLDSSDISVCPYCNRQFISSFEKEGDTIKTTGTLDHFYPKTYFSLFALSLYNFIPSCYSCNSILKTTKVKKILYPFKQGFENDAHFKIQLNEYSNLDSVIGNNEDFEITIDNPHNIKEIDNSIELFQLENIYKYHKDHVKSIICKSYIYSESYQSLINKTFDKLDLSESNLKSYLFNIDIDDKEQTNRILGRLTVDVLDQIEELKE